MKSTLRSQFIHLLEADLLLPYESVSLALKHHIKDWNLLPKVLWKYGLATLNQVSDMFDWLEAR